MEGNFKENQKLFYRTIKNSRIEKQTTLKQLKDKQGRIIKEDKAIMERWKEHFEELLEGTQSRNKDEVIDNLDPEITTANTEEEHISDKEMKAVLQKLRIGKAPGHDGIKAEQLKYMGEGGEQILLEMLNRMWEMSEIPKDWGKAVIFPIYKKGDNRNCNNYRGISLICTTAKIFEAILENKLREVTETKLEKAQSGFRKGHTTQDHIFTIRQLTEKTLRNNRKLFIGFIDLEKAFDRVPRHKMWEILEKLKISKPLLRAIKSVYKSTTNYIRTDNDTSEEFETTQGLRQGGALSPMLFIIFIDDILKRIKDKSRKVEIGYHKMNRITIAECAFADDLAIMAKSEEDLQHNINVWNDELRGHNMTINEDKTKIMVISREDIDTEITLNGRAIEQVQTFKYLGVILNNKGGLEHEINNRIQSANRTFHALNRIILNNKSITKGTKMTLFKTIYRPTLIYGSETWIVNQRLKSKIQASEMRYLRRVEGVTRIDRIRNEQIRTRLQTESVQNTIEKKQLAWYGHLIRMPEDRQTKIVWSARITTKRNRGRPAKTWEDSIEEILNRNNIHTQEAKKTAKDRKAWKELVNKIT